MTSIVLRLQEDALDRNCSVTDLLRKGLVVAKKLHILELIDWVTKELEGYNTAESLPPYRQLRGEVKGLDPSRSWIPVRLPTAKLQEKLSVMGCLLSLPELEILFNDAKASSGLQMPFDHETQAILGNAIGVQTQFVLALQRSTIGRVLDAVRTVVLKWAIKLEEDGITGDGLSFSSREKDVAARTTYTINNFYGSMQTVQIQQSTSSSKQIAVIDSEASRALGIFLDDLRAAILPLALKEPQDAELTSEIRTIEQQLTSPKPKSAIIREALISIRSILESAAGSAAYSLLPRLSELISMVM